MALACWICAETLCDGPAHSSADVLNYSGLSIGSFVVALDVKQSPVYGGECARICDPCSSLVYRLDLAHYERDLYLNQLKKRSNSGHSLASHGNNQLLPSSVESVNARWEPRYRTRTPLTSVNMDASNMHTEQPVHVHTLAPVGEDFSDPQFSTSSVPCDPNRQQIYEDLQPASSALAHRSLLESAADPLDNVQRWLSDGGDHEGPAAESSNLGFPGALAGMSDGEFLPIDCWKISAGMPGNEGEGGADGLPHLIIDQDSFGPGSHVQMDDSNWVQHQYVLPNAQARDSPNSSVSVSVPPVSRTDEPRRIGALLPRMDISCGSSRLEELLRKDTPNNLPTQRPGFASLFDGIEPADAEMNSPTQTATTPGRGGPDSILRGLLESRSPSRSTSAFQDQNDAPASVGPGTADPFSPPSSGLYFAETAMAMSSAFSVDADSVADVKPSLLGLEDVDPFAGFPSESSSGSLGVLPTFGDVQPALEMNQLNSDDSSSEVSDDMGSLAWDENHFPTTIAAFAANCYNQNGAQNDVTDFEHTDYPKKRRSGIPRFPAGYPGRGSEKLSITDEDFSVNGSHFVCRSCDFSCKPLHVLEHHINDMHKKTKPYPCPHCDKAFYARRHVNDHIKQLHGNQPVPCNCCGKVFGNALKMQRHLANKRRKEQESVLQCELDGAQ